MYKSESPYVIGQIWLNTSEYDGICWEFVLHN